MAITLSDDHEIFRDGERIMFPRDGNHSPSAFLAGFDINEDIVFGQFTDDGRLKVDASVTIDSVDIGDVNTLLKVGGVNRYWDGVLNPDATTHAGYVQDQRMSFSGGNLNVDISDSIPFEDDDNAIADSQNLPVNINLLYGAWDGAWQRVSTDGNNRLAVAVQTSVLPPDAATETTLSGIKTQTDKLNFSGPLLRVDAGIVISTGNSFSGPLGAAGTFNGTAEDVRQYQEITLNIGGAPPVAPGTFYFEFSPDSVNWDVSVPFVLTGPGIVPYSLRTVLPYFRVRYVNGATPLTALRLTTVYHITGAKHLTRFLNQEINDTEPVENVRAFIGAKRPSGIFGNIQSTESGNLNVATPQIEDTGNSVVITSASPAGHTPGVPFVGAYFLTRSNAVQENISIIAAVDSLGAPLSTLGGTVIFEYSEDGVNATVRESRIVNSFSEVRAVGWLSNVGAYYRINFEPDRALVPGETVFISTYHSLSTGNDFKRLASQVLEEANQALTVNMSFLKAFNSAGDSRNLRSTAATESIPLDQDALTVKNIATGVSPDGVFANLPASGPHSANSTETPLGIAGQFLGSYLDLAQYSGITVSINADQNGTLFVEHSSDGINIATTSAFTVSGNVPFFVGVIPLSRYARIRYVNGAVAQTLFRLSVIARVFSINPRFEPINTTLDQSSVAQLVRSVLTGRDATDGLFRNIGVEGDRLRVVAPPPANPAGTTPRSFTLTGPQSGSTDNVFIIPNGANLHVQRLTGGSASSVSGGKIELFYDPTGTGTPLTFLSVIYANGASRFEDLTDEFIGDGVAAVRLRRTNLSGGSIDMFARWTGYTLP